MITSSWPMNTSTDQTAMDLPSCMVGIESMVGSSRDLLCPRSCLKSRHGTSAVTCPRSALAQDRVQRRPMSESTGALRGQLSTHWGWIRQRCAPTLVWKSVPTNPCIRTISDQWCESTGHITKHHLPHVACACGGCIPPTGAICMCTGECQA